MRTMDRPRLLAISCVLLLATITAVFLVRKATIVHDTIDRDTAVLQEMPLAIIVADENGNIIRSNSSLQRTLGYNDGELLGKSIETIVAPEIRGSHRRAFEVAVRRLRDSPKSELDSEYATNFLRRGTAITKTGERIEVVLLVGPVMRQNHLNFVGTLRTLSEWKQVGEAFGMRTDVEKE